MYLYSKSHITKFSHTSHTHMHLVSFSGDTALAKTAAKYVTLDLLPPTYESYLLLKGQVLLLTEQQRTSTLLLLLL